MKSLCIDLGGTNIKAGVIIDDKLIYSCREAAQADASFTSVVKTLEKLVQKLLLETALSNEQFQGIGLSMPGIIDVDRNRVIAIKAKHEEAIGFNFNDWSQAAFDLPIVMENDARAALLGEWQYGKGRGYQDIAMMTLGTGVGGAALLNGKLIHGKHYQAGCLGGHFTIDYQGTTCNCGNVGCVEAEASSWRLRELVLEQPGGEAFLRDMTHEFNFKTLFELKRHGNNIAKRVVETSLKVWSAAVVNLIHAYDPEVVIISGGIMKSSDDILPFIRKWVAEHAWTPGHEVHVLASGETENIALWGMHYLLKKESDQHSNGDKV